MTNRHIHYNPESNSPLTPFLKWPGGKRWLVRKLISTLENRAFQTYYEPFLGGGALFFALRPNNSVLTDLNDDLINTYHYVKYHPDQLIDRLRELSVTQTTYYTLRESEPRIPLDRAVRFLFLNRTAFGGMYRLNQSGKFNVPYGGGERTPQPLWQRNLISHASRALENSTLKASDFEPIMGEARSGDLIYCDPTYTVAHNNNGFIRYNEKNFSWDDQKRLANSCKSASHRGAFVIVTNAVHNEILTLFNPTTHTIVNRYNCLCPIPKFRGYIEEYLFIYQPKST